MDWSFHVELLDVGKSNFLRFTEIWRNMQKNVEFSTEMYIIREVCVRVYTDNEDIT